MPKTKFQGVIFGLIMSYSMAYGMEVYNIAIKMGFNLNRGGFSNMTNIVFWEAFKEAAYMGAIVFVISSLWGNRIGAGLSKKLLTPGKDSPLISMIARQGCTVMIMCPSMSLAASILFNIIMAKQSLANLPAIWIGTVIKNFPMALCWNMFYAAPFTRLVFRLIFKDKKKD